VTVGNCLDQDIVNSVLARCPTPSEGTQQGDVLAGQHPVGELQVHAILNNLSTHKTPQVQQWLLRHQRFHFHFTPTYGSWMNLVERWFAALTTGKLQRSAHRSVKELAAHIRGWVEHWSENRKPFTWHKTAEEILDRLAGYCAAINKSQGASA
jgi:transposase